MLDALAPGVMLAQALGRWGNWFNQDAPRQADRPAVGAGRPPDDIARDAGFHARGTTFHPTFLYECLWNIAHLRAA